MDVPATAFLALQCLNHAPGKIPYISLFWGDSIAGYCGGHVYYRLTTLEAELTQSNRIAKNYIAKNLAFHGKQMLIATWYNVVAQGACNNNPVRWRSTGDFRIYRVSQNWRTHLFLE